VKNTIQGRSTKYESQSIYTHEKISTIMSEMILNQQILADMAFLKEKILKIEMDISEIDDDLHVIRPDYLVKLKKIDTGRFISRADFEKELLK